MRGSKWLILVVLLAAASSAFIDPRPSDDRFVSYIVDPRKQDIQFYYKNERGQVFGSIQQLKDDLSLQHKRLVFAMNGGMFKAGQAPVGLFIQKQTLITPLDTSSGTGNFYLKPNGVLCITNDNKAVICTTGDLISAHMKFATQSGPMLLMNGEFHPALKKGSANLNIRNGVGLLPDGKLVFAMSKEPINFYDFAEYFKNLGCKNALYLDGFVSRTYLPEQHWLQTDGNFGVIIGVTVAEK